MLCHSIKRRDVARNLDDTALILLTSLFSIMARMRHSALGRPGRAGGVPRRGVGTRLGEKSVPPYSRPPGENWGREAIWAGFGKGYGGVSRGGFGVGLVLLDDDCLRANLLGFGVWGGVAFGHMCAHEEGSPGLALDSLRESW